MSLNRKRYAARISLAAFAIVANATSAAPFSETAPSIEILDSDGISLTQASVQLVSEIAKWELTSSIAANRYEIDYEPADFDLLSSATERTEENYSLQFNARRYATERLSLLAGAGYYNGHSSYGSIWLDEYFRQRFSNLTGVEGAENFIEADPWGINATLGARWEYIRGSGFAQITVSQIRDNVSPGYEIDFEGLQRSDITLATSSVSLSTENILSRRLRSLFEVRASQTTDREVRYSAQYSLNAAIGEKWIARGLAGASLEDPEFEAYFGQIAVEYQINDFFGLYADARYYEDTGEIEDALLFSSAAPGLVSERFGIGARFSSDTWKARIYIAPFETDYEPTNSSTDFFQNLYRDRDWTVFQLSFQKTF